MRRRSRGSVFILVIVVAVAACSTSAGHVARSVVTSTSVLPSTSAAAGSPAPPVPSGYQQLASTLATRISDLQARGAKGVQAGSSVSPVLAAELLNANANIGPGLLAPTAMSGVTLALNRFQQLGIRGVTVELGFPMLLASYQDHDRYLSFYEQVASAVHKRGMQLDIEENPAFPGFTAERVNYAGLTLETYARQQAEEAQLIVDHLHPTYLTILDETDTFAFHLNLPLNNPAAAVTVVGLELSGLRRGDTKVGAGTGTWMGPEIDQALLARTSIDYLSVHVYPIDSQSLDHLDADVAAATQAGKPVVMDETWLYKQEPPGIGGANATNLVSGLDGFSFFGPLDQQFLAAMVGYDRAHGVVFVSPFWTGELFAYLDWTPALDAQGPAAVRNQTAVAVSAAMRSGTFSATGRAYGILASQP